VSTPPDAADRALVERLDDVWSRLADLGATLSAADWVRPTAVPGWSVQDNLAHLTDLERMLLGRDPVDHEVPEGLAHLRNDVGSRNEVFVDARRSWSGADVLAEFVEVTGARLAVLRALGAEGFGAESWTPMGPGTVRDLLPFRAFDSWVHEQDMREALGRPGGCTGPAAEAAMDRIVGTLGFVVGKSSPPPSRWRAPWCSRSRAAGPRRATRHLPTPPCASRWRATPTPVSPAAVRTPPPSR
jgi:uncharacterized protein (TIGR03083 family)